MPLCIAVGYVAHTKHRSAIGWFLFSVIFSPVLGILFVMAMPIGDTRPFWLPLPLRLVLVAIAILPVAAFFVR